MNWADLKIFLKSTLGNVLSVNVFSSGRPLNSEFFHLKICDSFAAFHQAFWPWWGIIVFLACIIWNMDYNQPKLLNRLYNSRNRSHDPQDIFQDVES